MEFLKRLSRGIECLSIRLGGFLLLLNVCDIVMGIVLRTITGAAPIWTEELARFSMVWMVMLGAAATFYHGDQMSIDFLVVKLPFWGKRLCEIFAVAVQSIVLGVLIFLGAQNVAGSWKMKTMALGVPKSIPLMAVPLGMSLLLAAVLLKCFMPKKEVRE